MTFFTPSQTAFINRSFSTTPKWALIFIFFLLGNLIPISGNHSGLKAQIYEPEGLNMSGSWNGWQNPPTNNLSLASSTQVSGGRVTKITTGTVRWQTWFSVAASGADLVGGNHTWLFTSGPSGSPWNNKWAGVNVTMNTLQNYTYNSGADNSITLSNGKFYTVNWHDNGYAGTQAIFMETSSLPVNLSNVSVPSNVLAGQQAIVNLTVDATPSPEENFYLRYTTNAWNSSSIVSFAMSGLGGTAIIPAQSAGAVVEYYVFSSTVTSISSDYDMQTIRLNNNGGSNYSYTVIGLSTQAEILGFSLPEQTGPATINSAAATVNIEVAHGTNVSSLSPTITVSAGATISPASGVAQNFSSPVVYTVTAQDGTTTKNWTVTVSVAAPPPPNYGLRDDGGVNLPTLTYWYSGQSNDITQQGSAFNGQNFGSVSSFLFKGASIKTWKSGTGDVTGAQFNYKVWSSSASEPGSYTVRNVGWTSNDGGGDQTWANFGSPIDITSGLTPGTYNVKILFSITGTGVAGTTENGPFTAQFTFVVLSSAAEITSFSLPEQTGPATINSAAATVNIEVAHGTNVTSLTPTITVSAGATISPASGVAQNFSSPVVYTVTAQDGTTTKNWTVTVSVAAPPPPNYGLRDDGGVNLPTLTYWYSGQSNDITQQGSAFNGQNFGSVSSFLFKGASIKTWKSGSGDVTGAQFNYKVWSTSASEPNNYTVRNVGWTSNDGGGDQTWANFGDPIDLGSGLTPGTYNVKILFSITGTGVAGTTENGPFSAQFTFVVLSTAAEITSFSLPEQTGPATINSTAATVNIEVAHGTNLTSLTPTITVSAGATISPASGLAQNFSSPVVYTVTAQDGSTTKNWTVTVSVAAPPPPNYGLRDDGGVNLPTLTYWYSGQSNDITQQGSAFNGQNFGSVSSFLFKGASIKTWKSGSGDVTGAQFNYKVWSTSANEPGSYTVRNVGWTSNDGGGDQTWANFGDPIDLGSGLTPGTYNVKILFSITGTGVAGTTENGPFSAQFTFVVLSSAAEITSFSLPEQTGPATINSAAATVSIEVAHGTDVSSLTPTITVSAGATISPASGVAQNFNSPVVYTVTAQDGTTTKNWTVTVSVAAPPPPNYGLRDDGGVNLPTLTYWYSGQSNDITQQGSAFNGQNFGSVSSFLFKGASIKTWKSGTGDVTGAQFNYKVWSSSASEPGSYTVRNVGWTSNDGGDNQTWANFGSPIDLTSGLTPGTYNVKILFSITGTGVAGTTENGPFSAQFTFVVLSTAAEITSFSLPEQTGPATINSAAATVNIEVAYGTNVTSLTPTITVSAGATISPASGVAQNFSSPVVYTVTAQDGTTKNWTVTVSVAAPPPMEWVNLQWPGSGTIVVGQAFNVYAQAYAAGITNPPGQASGLQAWIGYSATNTDPADWTNWQAAAYFGQSGNNDEFMFNLGSVINTPGTYYYASRFSLNGQPYVYGGFSTGGGGFWNGNTNVSGTLVVQDVSQTYPVTFTVNDGTQSYTDIRLKGQMTNWNPVPMVQGPANVWTLTLNLLPGTYEWGAIQHDGSPNGVWLIQGPNLVVTVDPNGGITGTTTYNIPAPPPAGIEWANLQWPPSATIEPSQTLNVYGRVYIPGVTGGPVAPAGLQAWVGYSTTNTNPSGWTNWIPATFNTPSGNNTEYVANLGAQISTNGTYYYAFRYQYQGQSFVYGGYSVGGGGPWNGTTNISGTLTVGVNINCEDFRGVVYTLPSFPTHNQTLTIYFDATKGSGALLNYTGDVYAHTAVITNLSSSDADWRYTRTSWGENTPSTLLTRLSANLYSLTIPNPRTYYGVPANEIIRKLVIVFRSATTNTQGNWLVHKNADGSDIYIKIYEPGLNIKFNNPLSRQTLLTSSATLPVCIEGTGHTQLSFYINSTLVRQTTANGLSYQLSYQQMPAGNNWIKAVATNGSLVVRDSVEVYVRGAVNVAALPPGVKKGINYIGNNTVTLVLHDPIAQKQFSYVIGDFNNWTVSDAGYMNRTPDGTHYWITISGLTPGEEYGFQYFLDGTLRLADPYSELILDPWNDPWIPASKYPNLKPYPTGKTEGIVTLIQPGRPAFNWQAPNFTPPAVNNTQSDLVIYELLLRDFNDTRSIADAITKLDYLKSIGVNAIQLMPIMEFDGNNSWGYSTNFFFATDKYYGTREAYKQFIDAAHQKGMAVILDVVMNHAFGLNPFVKMYFDPNFGGYGAPAANNPWLNQQSPHPYSVGYDFNHESTHTRQFFKDMLQYWLTEFKVDGFRIDLSKGLTQNYSGGDIGSWNAYDQSRVNIIMDYFGHIKWVKPNAYVILEHFANNDEETVLANAGMMLWSAMHYSYKQVAMGWENNSNVQWAYHGTRGWTYPNLIDYMESHDEERMVYEALAYGNQSQWYNLRDSLTAIRHQEQAIVLFMGIPGPKMLWQFQEMGYDYSIWYGGDRTAPKPPRWDYLDNPVRERLARVVRGMADLRKSDAFRFGNFAHDLGGLGKRMWITHSSMDVVMCVNMGVIGFDMIPNFTKPGTWYDYFTGEAINVTNPATHSFFFGPGDYRVFTSVPRAKPWHQLTVNVRDAVTNQPIANARVQLANAGGRTTGTSGQVQFLALPGINELTASKFGYINGYQTVNISANTEITILLQPGWDPQNNFANLQWSPTAEIIEGQSVDVYAQVQVQGLTPGTNGYEGMQVWIGYNSSNTNPNTWTNWIPATYNGVSSFTGRPEYTAAIGSTLSAGTYYYASRFQLPDQPYIYGGWSSTGGGFWNGTTNISGVLTVSALPPPGITFANLQWPPTASIVVSGSVNVYAQVQATGLNLGSSGYEGLNAWIGYGAPGTAPNTWTNWIPASYNGVSGFTGRPEYSASIGSNLPEGNYHYATRFQIGSGNFVYGGYSASGGGFWDGTANVSGVLIVSSTGPVPSIGWANLQGPASGVITPGQNFSVFGEVWIENTTGSGNPTPGLQAWVGYASDNTNPNTWTIWVPATYNGAVGNNDRFTAEIGSLINSVGTYYYATRYQYLDQPFVYGGLNGPWDEITSPSGVLTVTTTPPAPEITFANLQWPPTASIVVGGSVTVYAQVQATGVNLGTSGYEGLSAWIGYGAPGTAPSTWTNWVPASYNGVSGFTGRPEYSASIGSNLPEGNYHYATRFQIGSGSFVYGGYSASGGGFWDGTANVSGVLNVSSSGPVPSIGWANLQGPASGVITPGQNFSVFGQVWIENTTGSGNPTPGLQAWVGYASDNTNPASWTNWVPATYNGAVGNNDRFTAEIGSMITSVGTYYYATRYKYLDQPFVYGGLNGPWDEITSPSGMLTVTTTPPAPEINFANLQWPPTASIVVGGSVTVYAQVQATGVNLGTSGYEGLNAWIGYGAMGTAPNTWTNWVPASYNGVSGFTGRPEYSAPIGSNLPEGNYDYASRFQIGSGNFVYGGYSASGGGFWDGTANVSGVLIVSSTGPVPSIGWANLQGPASGVITPAQNFSVFGEVWIENTTGSGNPTPGLQAWVGYASDNTNPNTWTIWMPATYNGAVGNNDRFTAEIGSLINSVGTYYYATRYQYLDQPFVYGGLNGPWDEITSPSGVLTVTTTPPAPEITFANLQWPPTASIVVGGSVTVYAQVQATGVNLGTSGYEGLSAWIGYGAPGTAPNTWTNWVPASYNGVSGFTGRPEYSASIGSNLPEGNYDYATRFQIASRSFVYGGYSASGGGFWDGTANVSGLLTVSSTGPVPSIGWANLQGPASGVNTPGQNFSVFGEVWIENTTGSGNPTPGLQAWVGYASDNTNPASWTNWVPATFNGAVSNNDRFTAEIGSMITSVGTYYYATRYKYLDQPFVYGGLNGPWDEITSPSGMLTVTTTPPAPEINFANLQWPPTASIVVGGSVTVYAQVQATGVNLGTSGYEGLNAWIGYGAMGTAPNTWTNWVPASYNGVSGFTGRPEYSAPIGSNLPEGNYDYASRFQIGSGSFVYGGYSASGGGFWDGTANVSGVLNVSSTGPVPSIGWANLQGPASGVITPGQNFSVFGEVWIENTTGSGSPTPGLQAWVGYASDNTNPNTWTNWVPATYNGAVGNNDRFTAEIGSLINSVGTYYYATRYQYLDQPFVYGGLNGPWDEITSPSGVLTVTTTPPAPEITFANLQWPPTASIVVGGSVTVYAQVQATGVNLGTSGYEGLNAWIGYGAPGTAPNTWTNWVPASYNGVSGFTGRPEYSAAIGSNLPEGNYDYATRFQIGSGSFVYGGYSASGGGFWDGTANVSGLLTVLSTGPVPSIGWANLQGPESGVITPGQNFSVFGEVWIENTTGSGSPTPGLQAWVGYASDNTNPNTWTNWVPATYNGAVGNNDRFTAEIGSLISSVGTYYYATRYKYLDQPFVYGGLNGPWDEITSPSGVLTVTTTPPTPEITFANLQWPPTASIVVGGSVAVYAQVQATGLNLGTSGYEGLNAWIGYGAPGTAPSTWTNWAQATYNGVSGFTGRPEYKADLGPGITTASTYHYATRFQLAGQPYIFGGYSTDGGGFWNGTGNVSGVLTVTSTPPEPVIGWANLQWPGSAQIQLGEPLMVYAQAWIENITGQGTATPGLQAWIGFSTQNTDPATWTSWVPASFNVAVGNNDEFSTNLAAYLPGAGTYYFASRFRYLMQTYVYGGFSNGNGGFWDGTTNISGVVTVTGQATSYPVLFAATDLTGLYQNIKLKGSMTNWQPVAMQRNGNVWTVTLQLLPGVYEWGVMEDDGSPEGIWLVGGSNLVVAVDINGNISGTTSYTITYVGLEENQLIFKVFPNPNLGRFTLEVQQPGQVKELWITDLTGNIILRKNHIVRNEIFDLSPLHSGVYLLYLHTGKGLLVHKIIKLR